MSGTKGIAIQVSVADAGVAGKLDALNKRIAALSAPADRVSKSLSKFGEVTGISRAAEGVQTFGDRALGAARSIERLVTPLGALTSLASIAGIAELSRRWSEAGANIGKTAYLLSAPVEKLSSLRLAAKISGSSADALEGSLRSLGETLSDVKWNRPGNKRSLLDGIFGTEGTNRVASKSAIDALGDVADAVQKQKTPHAQMRLLEQLGISADLLPLLKNGRQGLAEFQKQAEATGGVMTGSMVEHATKMNAAWAKLGGAIDGAVNRLVDKYAPAMTEAIEAGAKWIAQNPKLVEAIGEIGTAVTALIALKPALWLLRLLGLGAAVPGGVAAAGAAGALSMLGPAGTPVTDQDQFLRDREHDMIYNSWFGRRFRSIFGGAGANGPGGPRGAVPSGPILPGPRANPSQNGTEPRGIRNNNPLNLEFRPAQGASGSDGRFGIYARMEDGVAAAARQLHRYDKSYGLNTVSGIINRWAPPGENNSGEYAATVARSMGVATDQKLDLDNPQTMSNLIEAMARVENGKPIDPDAIKKGVEIASRVPNGVPGTGPVFGPQAGASPTGGAVQVDIRLHGAPRGTTATARASGAAVAPPPRIETSMQGIQ